MPWEKYTWEESQLECMMVMLHNGVKRTEMGAFFGCDPHSITKALMSVGVPKGISFRGDYKTGKYAPNWKGGKRSTCKDGYVQIYMPEHHMANNRQYVFEHRLVVENHLISSDSNSPALQDGRLRRDWVVHHKNGNKQDNRISNLQALPKSAHHTHLHCNESIAYLRSIISDLEALVSELKEQSIYA